MKSKALMAVSLALVMLLTLAAPAFAGSAVKTGSQRKDLVLSSNHTTVVGFVVFNVDQIADTIRVNVSAKNLPIKDGEICHNYTVTLWSKPVTGGDWSSWTKNLLISGRGNGGAAFVLERGPGDYCVYVTLFQDYTPDEEEAPDPACAYATTRTAGPDLVTVTINPNP